MMIVGLSTGCLHTWDMDIYEKINRILASSAEAIEINICDFNDFMVFDPLKVNSGINRMKIISFHLPWSGIIYGCNNETDMIMRKMAELKRHFPIKTFTVHSNLIESFDIFENFELLVENLESPFIFGSTAAEIRQIKSIYNPNFLFDITHSFLVDSSMRDAEKIVEVMGDSLKMVHASGFKSGNSHSMICGADNQALILEWIKKLKHLPIILEGQVHKPELINKDIELLKDLE